MQLFSFFFLPESVSFTTLKMKNIYTFNTRRSIREAGRIFFIPKRLRADEASSIEETHAKEEKYESIDELIRELSNGSHELREVNGEAEKEHEKDVICPICNVKILLD
jgi:hypothetical protein